MWAMPKPLLSYYNYQYKGYKAEGNSQGIQGGLMGRGRPRVKEYLLWNQYYDRVSNMNNCEGEGFLEPISHSDSLNDSLNLCGNFQDNKEKAQ